MEGWRTASAQGRIATLPEFALARIGAPRPHAPGKPWECYIDGSSPLWQHWTLTSTCLLVGRRGGETVFVIAHGLTPEDAITNARNGAWFRFSQIAWERALASVPHGHVFDANGIRGHASTSHEHGWFRKSDVMRNPLFAALFGDALEPYAEDHRRLASEYMFHVASYACAYDPRNEEHRAIIADPPILSVNYEISYVDLLPEGPERGAVGRYLCLNPVMNVYSPEFRPRGIARVSDIDLVKPTDDAKFLVLP